jgi:immune inhibitor A
MRLNFKRLRVLRICLLLVLVTAAASAFAPARANVARQTEGNPPGAETLALLQKTIVPDNDAVDLAKRLRGVTEVPPYPDKPLKEYKVGDTEKFWVSNQDSEKDIQIEAKLLYITPHVYMWWDVSADQPKLAAVKASADKFERDIYPTVRKYFGSEESPGVDGDVRLYILNATGMGFSVAGYYSSSSGEPRIVNPRSNQAQIFLMNAENIGQSVGSDYYDSVLAHEFQHMVHDAVDPNEETWLNEGLSELASLIAGYGTSGFARSFLTAPSLQLNTWGDGDNAPHYGAAFLFTAYFLQRTSREAVTDLVSEKENGLTGVDLTLKKLNIKDAQTGQPVTAIDLFADWTVTNLLNDQKVGDGRYAYTLFKDRVPPATTPTSTPSVGKRTVRVNQFGTRYTPFTKEGEYTFKFEGATTTKVVGAEAHSGKKAFWSNRADKSDMTLTQEFDLTGVQKATFKYWTWYSIERGWDYAYVQVSEDGKTWKMLTTKDMIDEDPHGNAYGIGYGGVSGNKEDDKADPEWIEQSIDLSAFAGKKIQLRFEMITDDAFVAPGMLIDDVSIPEINYSTDFENDDGGWQPNGWIRMDNILPQRFIVQKVTIGNDKTTVERLLSPADGNSGEWTFSVGGGVEKVVIVVSGVTDYTTEQAPYQYELSVKE